MNNKTISKKTIDRLIKTSSTVSKVTLKKQKEQIEKDSSYSSAINNAFSTYDEFYYLHSLRLQEAFVNRRALIREIDFDLFVSCEEKTNYELMSIGKAPYAYDDPLGQIILHHIGQQKDGPYAELTQEQHSKSGHTQLLHTELEDSWRNEESAEWDFAKEREQYWLLRAKGNITLFETKHRKITKPKDFDSYNETMDLIKKTVELLFAECSVADLNYFSNRAHGHALIKELGVSTIDDFIMAVKNDDDSILQCPKCESKDFVCYGYQKRGNERIRRYKCKQCEAVFNAFNNSIISGCNFNFFEWIQFIDCLYNGCSIEKTAQICNISEKTAFDNRLRLFYALKLLDDQVRLQDDVIIDETYFAGSYKGNHSNSERFTMPRAAHRRGKEIRKPGTSKEQVCVVCALDSNGNSVARISGMGNPKASNIAVALGNAIDIKNTSCLYTDGELALKRYAEDIDVPIQQSISKKRKGKMLISNYSAFRKFQRINAYHSRLARFMNNFNGISSKMLSGYLYLFAWKERNRDVDTIDAYKELFSIILRPNLKKTIQEIEDVALFPSVESVETEARQKATFKDLEYAKAVYRRYADGEAMKSIAKSYGYSLAAISKMIRKFKRYNLAYKTKKEIRQEQDEQWSSLLKDEIRIRKYGKEFTECYLIYLAKLDWVGSEKEFYACMCQETGLKEQTIKNKIVIAKRVLALKEHYGSQNHYHYDTMEEKYYKISCRYSEIKRKNPSLLEKELIRILAQEFKYKETSMRMMLSMIKRGVRPEYSEKMPVSETLNRDRQVFADLLNWQGTKKEFYEYAKEKYGASTYTVNTIIKYNCMADPNRFAKSKLN